MGNGLGDRRVRSADLAGCEQGQRAQHNQEKHDTRPNQHHGVLKAQPRKRGGQVDRQCDLLAEQSQRVGGRSRGRRRRIPGVGRLTRIAGWVGRAGLVPGIALPRLGLGVRVLPVSLRVSLRSLPRVRRLGRISRLRRVGRRRIRIARLLVGRRPGLGSLSRLPVARRGVGRLRRRQRVVAVDARLGPRWIPGGTAIRARGRLIGLHLGAAEGYQFNSLPTRFLAAAGRQPAPPQASSSLRSAALRTA